jgi:hypothetical protein
MQTETGVKKIPGVKNFNIVAFLARAHRSKMRDWEENEQK